MTLKKLTDPQLLERLSKLVRTERKITHLVLECIAEIDQRKLYLDRAYPSLFEYLTQAQGYSAAAAQRRISAARLLQEIPEIAKKIEDGKINLSQIALASRSIKIAEKTFCKKVDPAKKRELFKKLETKSFDESQALLVQELKIDLPKPENSRPHPDGSVTLTFTLTAIQYQDWLRAGELASHAVPNRKLAELAHYLAQREISRRTAVLRKSKSPRTSGSPRQIRPFLRKRLVGEGSGCVYRDPVTGRRCGSRHFLQVDHIRSVRTEGDSRPENLQVLCSSHNRRKYELEIRSERRGHL